MSTDQSTPSPTTSGNTVKIVIAIVVVSLSAVAGNILVEWLMEPGTPASTTTSVTEFGSSDFLEAVIAESKIHLPMPLDQFTTWVDMESDDAENVLVYVYVLDIKNLPEANKADLVGTLETLRPTLQKTYDTELGDYSKRGIRVKYSYQKENGDIIHEMMIGE